MNYYERHIGDYLKDAAHLSLLEHGVYGRLLDVYYTRECGIDAATVARLIGARTDEERSALDGVLDEFFVLCGDVWTHCRCDREIEKYRDKQRKASASASARWAKPDPHSERNANAMPTQSEGNALQTPDTSNQTPKIKEKKRASAPLNFYGVGEQVIQDFTALRNSKRAKLTQTAIDGIQREAAKAGRSLQDALEMCCARGWTGFKADWVRSDQDGYETPYARSMREKYESVTPLIAAKRPGTLRQISPMEALDELIAIAR